MDILLHRPKSIEEALTLKAQLEDARLLAGGTDLLVDIKQGLVSVKNLISLQDIPGLRGIREEGGSIWIGAMTTPEEVQGDERVNRHVPGLVDAARSMAAAQIRSTATIGGNIASAVPSADLPPSLMAADASVLLVCGTTREIRLSEFFAGVRETACGPGEVLTAIRIPIPPPGTGSSYRKMALREANALAVVAAAAQISLEGDRIAKAAVVLGAVAPTPVLAAKASEYLCGKVPSESLLREAAALAAEEGKPITDIRGSAWYRKELIPVMARRALDGALARIKGRS